MSSWLQRLVVTISMPDDSSEALKYAAFLADTYDAALDVMIVTHCARSLTRCDAASASPHAAAGKTCLGKVAAPPSPSEQRERIAAMLAALPSRAAREAEIEVGEPQAIEAALRRRHYDLALLDEQCGHCCPACLECPVIEAVKELPSCGMMRVEGPVKLPQSE